MLRDRSEILTVDVDGIPQALKDAPRWAIWKAEPKTQADGTTKLDKVPYRSDRTDTHARSNDPASWSRFEEAYQAYQDRERTGADGLFFALGDGFAAVDIDDSVDPVTREPDEAGREVIDAIGSYAERSVSGAGARIFAFGPETKGIKVGRLELYSRQRFMTVTGQRITGTSPSLEHRESELNALRERLEMQRIEAYRARCHDRIASTAAMQEGASVDGDAVALRISDEEIIDTGLELEGFAQLWRGVTDAYDGDSSRADLALAGRLAFLCGPGQQERVRRLMEQSGLVRAKWFTHRTYLMDLTIARAYEGRTEYYPWALLPEGFGDPYARAARLAAEGAGTEGTGGGVATMSESGDSSDGGGRSGADDGVDDRPTIVLGPETDSLLRELECHMAPHLYQQNSRLVRVEQCDSANPQADLRRPKGSHQIVAVPMEMTQRLLSRHVRFVTSVATGRGKLRKTVTQQVSAPTNLAKLFTNCGGWSNIPHLFGITTTPFIRRDGVIVSDLPPLNGTAFRERISGGANQGRARDATREEVHGGADHWEAPRG